MGNCIGTEDKPNVLHKIYSISEYYVRNDLSNGGIATTYIAKEVPQINTASTYTYETIDYEEYPDGRILEAPNLRVFSLSELKNATRNFSAAAILGEGGFGTVYKGWVDEKTLSPENTGFGMAVAVKKLNPESTQGLEEWKCEVDFLGRLLHPNLVRLLGYCIEAGELLLAYEFMPNGSLENHLFRKGGSAYQKLSWELRLEIAISAARGLTFLHTSEKQIIYRDFKTSNILLDSNFNAKLSDFGLAKTGPAGEKSHVTTRVMGTFGYAAPEYVATGHLYLKSDVYGFGVVLLELMTGLRALDTSRPSGQHNLVEFARPLLINKKKVAQLMDPRLEGKYPFKGAWLAAQLALRCVAINPKSRPSMLEVVSILEEIKSIKFTPTEGKSSCDGDGTINLQGGSVV